jgi:hypothetical protein
LLQNKGEANIISLSYKKNDKELHRLVQEQTQKDQLHIQDFEILIPYGNIEYTDGQIASFNNLFKYKGIVFPKNAKVNTLLPEYDILSKDLEHI